jgi:NAD(P)-dependent dehydrogenase (short-subunit alcohol dehydrogenase family)/acyl carrier protein
MLPVATAFHSPIVDSAATPFTAFLQDIKFEPAAVPVYANTTAREYPQDAAAMRALIGAQLAKPVRFAEKIQAMYDAGARIFIEVGPGSVLTSLTRACLEGKPHLTVPLDLKGKDAVTGLWTGLGKLAAAGVSIDLEFAWRDYDMPAERPVPSPHAIMLSGSNAGKRFPRPEEPAVIRPKTAAPVPQSGDSRLEAIRQIQEEMATSHAAAQRALSEAHLAYLRVTEASLAHVDGRGSQQLPPVEIHPLPTVVQPVLEPVPAAPPPVVSSNLSELVMSVVAEKTGYPREILDPSMDLEADLGIDSIKRVQILAAVCEARPDLPQADAKNMATLRTLGAILDFLQQQRSQPADVPAAAESLTDLVLTIVAEKTGYPRDILTSNMDLEADLGIDSIKRVQILAAVREQRPDLPDVDPKQMGALRTLGAIVAYLGEEQPAEALPALPEWVSKNGLQRVALQEVAAAYGNGVHEPPAWSRITVAGNIGEIHQSVSAGLASRGVQVSANGSDSEGTVFICGMPRNAEDVLKEAHRAFDAARGARGKRLFVTVTPAASPLRRALSALVKTFALEHPGVVAKSICVNGEGAGIAERIADEILLNPHETEITLQADGKRTRLKEVLLPVGTDFNTSLLDGRPAIVVSGGARGVTASCIRGLAEVAPLRLALLGRSPLEEIPAEFAQASTDAELKAAIVVALRARGESFAPREVESRARRVQANREIRETLDGLRQVGSEALYLPCDVTNAEAVTKALESIRVRWGSIDGLIHGAGVVEDKRIADKSKEQFERVFGTKVSGLRNLLDATRDDHMRFILLFSSVAGRYGNVGQVDYAMANATMSQMALEEALLRKTTLVRALGWGPWEGGMVTPDLRAHFAQRGIPIIPMEHGVAAFVRELCHHSNDPADVDVVLRAYSSTVPGDAH